MRDMLKDRIKKIDAAGAAACCLLVGLVVAGGVLPLLHKTREQARAADNFADRLAQLDGLSGTLTQVKTTLQKTEVRLADTERSLPTQGNMDDFMRQLAQVADDAGLRVDAVLPQKEAQGNAYRVVPIEISGVGHFDNCYRFLVGLRHMSRLTRLDHVVITSLTGDDQTHPLSNPDCKMTLTISTFLAR